MSPKDRLILGICLAPLLWVADSLLLAFSSGLGFVPSLLSSVTTRRLLVRIAVVLLVLIPAFCSYLGYVWRRYEIISMNKADDGSLFGEENSDDSVRRILFYALRLATVMKLSYKERERLRLLCYAHNIGLVMLPAQLQQRAPRTVSERTEYYKHAEYGAQIALSLPQLRTAAQLILLHEERYDGSGPNAMVGRSIPLACRIFSTVYLFDYLCSETGMGMSRVLQAC